MEKLTYQLCDIALSPPELFLVKTMIPAPTPLIPTTLSLALLPAEIRLRIYVFTLPQGPQTLRIIYDDQRTWQDPIRGSRTSLKTSVAGKWRFVNGMFNPLILQICRESRFEGLKLLRKRYERIYLRDDLMRRCWVDLERDMFWFDVKLDVEHEKLAMLPPQFFPFESEFGRKMKRVAVGLRLWGDWPFVDVWDCLCDYCRANGPPDEEEELGEEGFKQSFKSCLANVEVIGLVTGRMTRGARDEVVLVEEQESAGEWAQEVMKTFREEAQFLDEGFMDSQGINSWRSRLQLLGVRRVDNEDHEE